MGQVTKRGRAALGRMPQIQQQTNQWHVEAAIQG